MRQLRVHPSLNLLLLTWIALHVPSAWAQQTEPAASPSDFTARASWPVPVGDNGTFGLLLFDNLEWQRTNGADAFRWDVLGWRGGDFNRFWFKSEGLQNTSSSEGEMEVQGLYGKLVAPYFDLQAGVRVNQRRDASSTTSRAYAVVALQGLSPYRFGIEPALFVSNKGQISARFTASYDLLVSERLIFQPRLETNAAVTSDKGIGVGSGLNDAEIGFRVRYEVRREFAPYLGLTWKDSFGATRRLAAGTGAGSAHFAVAAGVRVWF